MPPRRRCLQLRHRYNNTQSNQENVSRHGVAKRQHSPTLWVQQLTEDVLALPLLVCSWLPNVIPLCEMARIRDESWSHSGQSTCAVPHMVVVVTIDPSSQETLKSKCSRGFDILKSTGSLGFRTRYELPLLSSFELHDIRHKSKFLSPLVSTLKERFLANVSVAKNIRLDATWIDLNSSISLSQSAIFQSHTISNPFEDGIVAIVHRCDSYRRVRHIPI